MNRGKSEKGGERERWQVSGDAAEVYERYLVPAIFGPWAPILVSLASIHPGERVLDLACGTGAVARVAAQSAGATGRVIGLDLNPGMLGVARSLPRAPGAPIEWREGDAVANPLADASFDVVLCQLGLQYFTDRSKALREVHRVLVPGGRLALLVWRPIQYSPGFATLAEALEHRISSDAAKIMHAPFSLGEPEELRSLLRGAGFGGVVIRIGIGTVRFPSPEALVSLYLAGSPLAGPVAKAGEGARMSLVKDVVAALEPYCDDEGLAFPIEGHLGLAQKHE